MDASRYCPCRDRDKAMIHKPDSRGRAGRGRAAGVGQGRAVSHQADRTREIPPPPSHYNEL
jgi:hypothetical protein